MKHLWPLLAWVLLVLYPAAGSRNGLGNGFRREVFFINFEDGYFGCQINESTNILQLFELSKLCDHRTNCYQGADEQRNKLKCTDDCTKEDGTKCQNGVCLNSVCHCNDGFGGCNCQVPDENECTYRPCDVFAYCTNTLGSFQCSCFPGYRGDGFHCEDIDECDNPELAERCVENAECCNLPSSFLCKCKSGYIGDGEVHCEDVNECAISGICGNNTVCHNIPGNYTCICRDGFTGNPYNNCVDINECEYESACGRDALCVNFPGSHKCECPQGYDGSPDQKCEDIDECLRNPCGHSAICTNVYGSFRCSCPEGMNGDPLSGCYDPCDHFSCGINAKCTPSDRPRCVCEAGFEGDPQQGCVDLNECANNPCSHDAYCINTIGNHVCECPEDMTGDPYGAGCTGVSTDKSECSSNDDCENYLACVQGSCVNPCDNITCDSNAYCEPDKHVAWCRCLIGFTKDKNNECVSQCNDFVCGTDAQCIVSYDGPICKCIEGFKGNPFPGGQCVPDICSTEIPCTEQSVCSNDLECEPQEICFQIGEDVRKCVDACSKLQCGPNAVCITQNHVSTCLCIDDYQGNPSNLIEGCQPSNGSVIQICKFELGCPPSFECGLLRSECPVDTLTCRDNSECPLTETCIGHTCQDPCLIRNPCVENAICINRNHEADCGCQKGYIGNGFSYCTLIPGESCDLCSTPVTTVIYNASKCAYRNHQNECIACDLGYQGDPHIGCQHVSVTQKDLCDSNPCGLNAICENGNGYPMCFCPKGLTGNPFEQCIHEDDQCNDIDVLTHCGANSSCRMVYGHMRCFCLPGYKGNPPHSPCVFPPFTSCDPSPCGPYTRCSVSENGFACTCLPGYIENPNTRGCVPKADQCEFNPCGFGAKCNSTRVPPCYCSDLTIGNPYKSCEARPVEPYDPCQLSLCGKNAMCIAIDGIAKCACISPFIGNPYIGCEAECIVNQDCGSHLTCINKHCEDPCLKYCGKNAHCEVVNHFPVCFCFPGYTGNPFIACKIEGALIPDLNPCMPSPCGPYSICGMMNDHAVCVCSPGYVGSPPHCRSDCLVNTDCPIHLACIKQKCNDPCLGLCGLNAYCQVINHNPMCSCVHQYVGDPLTSCVKAVLAIVLDKENNTNCCTDISVQSISLPTASIDPCIPSPCGPNALCQNVNDQLSCSCLPTYIGVPPSCRPECLINSDCLPETSCINMKCKAPCPGSCGNNTECKVVNHAVICSCKIGYTGDPFVQCVLQEVQDILLDINPCHPSPCGPSASCQVKDESPICSCIENYVGLPPNCRPECLDSSECPLTRACVNNKCIDPCPAFCDLNQKCEVINHSPTCNIMLGMQAGALSMSHIKNKPKTKSHRVRLPDPGIKFLNVRQTILN